MTEIIIYLENQKKIIKNFIKLPENIYLKLKKKNFKNNIFNKYKTKYSSLKIIYEKNSAKKNSFNNQKNREKIAFDQSEKIKKKILKEIENIFFKKKDLYLKKIDFIYNELLELKKNSDNLEINEQKYYKYLKIISQYKIFYKKILKIEKKVNKTIKNKIHNINLIIDKISSLNKKIFESKKMKNFDLNILINKKNDWIDCLNKIIGIKINKKDPEESIRIFDNILLVSNKLSYHIKNNHNFLKKTEGLLCFVNKSENTIDIPLKEIKNGGSLSGLSDVYLNEIIPIIKKIGQTILIFSDNFNEEYEFDILKNNKIIKNE